ncbi:solute carrier organic anion transporter family member 3A1 [Trichonephila inaurata madagascariensis]|uniref:Solute carrier organic anion transporter family member 3A1 n=1 Tax=Trichonephila inaurata madagascariensis TaxID=2747483 RepID=A0A8X7CAL6_9ARAC|nr:solute carrier organic anion transporter family member 3A1 [Trichonephila inaurata madagascariensis]
MIRRERHCVTSHRYITIPIQAAVFQRKLMNVDFSDPLNSRQLDSVIQYTSKIRAFIGLTDPEEDSRSPVSSLEHESGNDTPIDANDEKKNNDDDVSENLQELEKNARDKNTESDPLHSSEIENDNLGDVNNKNNVDLIDQNVEELVQNDDESSNKSDSDPLSEIPSKLVDSNDNEEHHFDVKLEELEKSDDDSNEEFIKTTNEAADSNNHSQLKETNDDINLITTTDESTVPSPESNIDFTIPHLLPNKYNTEIELHDSLTSFDEENAIPAQKTQNAILSKNTENTIVKDSEINLNEEESLLEEVNEKKAADNLDESLPVCDSNEDKENLLQLNENLGNQIDSKMLTDSPDDNIKAQLLENGQSSKEGQILNDPKLIMTDELNNIAKNLDTDGLEQRASVKESLAKTEESISLKADDLGANKDCTSEIIQNGEAAESFPNEPNTGTDQQNGTALPDETKPAPRMEDIRRLSVEIVNKVLDNAGNQLRDILNDKRNSKTSEILEGKDNLNKTGDADCHVSIKQPKGKNNEVQLKEILAKTYDFNDFQKKIEQEMIKHDPRYDLDPDTVCGMGCFKPQWIQKYATARVYLVLYSIIGIFSGSYYTYLIGSMSTLEKRFAFKSKTSGLIMMLDEITPLFLGIIVGYFGGKTHRPRMVGFGMTLSSICCFVSALPYFIYGPGTHLTFSNVQNSTKGIELCDMEIKEENCDSDDRPPTLAAILFLMCGSFLKGFGNLAYYAVGLAYMDDNAKKKNTPIYFAIAFALRLLGPGFGFFSAPFFLSENPFVMSHKHFAQNMLLMLNIFSKNTNKDDFVGTSAYVL